LELAARGHEQHQRSGERDREASAWQQSICALRARLEGRRAALFASADTGVEQESTPH